MVLILVHRDIDKRDADILHKILGKSEYEKMEEMRFGGILIYIYIYLYIGKKIFLVIVGDWCLFLYWETTEENDILLHSRSAVVSLN